MTEDEVRKIVRDELSKGKSRLVDLQIEAHKKSTMRGGPILPGSSML